MRLEGVATWLGYIAAVALGPLIFCVGVLFSLPLNVPAWFVGICISSVFAIGGSVGELVLRRWLNKMPQRVAAP